MRETTNKPSLPEQPAGQASPAAARKIWCTPKVVLSEMHETEAGPIAPVYEGPFTIGTHS
jgi:hypothetical protein